MFNRHHQKLVLGFLESARKMLSCDGEVHVTLKTTHPFNKWEVVNLAEKAGLVLIEKVPFKMRDYANKRGSEPNWNEKFHVGRCSTFKFSKERYEDLFIGIPDIFVDPNTSQLKHARDFEDFTSTNSIQANSAKISNLI